MSTQYTELSFSHRPTGLEPVNNPVEEIPAGIFCACSESPLCSELGLADASLPECRYVACSPELVWSKQCTSHSCPPELRH